MARINKRKWTRQVRDYLNELEQRERNTNTGVDSLELRVTQNEIDISALPGDWVPTKKSVAVGEELVIPVGYELMLFDEFTMEGDITLDGDLVVLN